VDFLELLLMAFFKRCFDDTPVREFGIKFSKENFGYVFISHPNKTAIDLISPDDPNFGAEMEGGTTFQPNNSDEVERWMSFRKKDVQTYDLKNGKWVLQKRK